MRADIDICKLRCSWQRAQRLGGPFPRRSTPGLGVDAIGARGQNSSAGPLRTPAGSSPAPAAPQPTASSLVRSASTRARSPRAPRAPRPGLRSRWPRRRRGYGRSTLPRAGWKEFAHRVHDRGGRGGQRGRREEKKGKNAGSRGGTGRRQISTHRWARPPPQSAAKEEAHALCERDLVAEQVGRLDVELSLEVRERLGDVLPQRVRLGLDLGRVAFALEEVEQAAIFLQLGGVEGG